MSKCDLYEEDYYGDPDNEYPYPDSSVLRNKFKNPNFIKVITRRNNLRSSCLSLT